MRLGGSSTNPWRSSQVPIGTVRAAIGATHARKTAWELPVRVKMISRRILASPNTVFSTGTQPARPTVASTESCRANSVHMAAATGNSTSSPESACRKSSPLATAGPTSTTVPPITSATVEPTLKESPTIRRRPAVIGNSRGSVAFRLRSATAPIVCMATTRTVSRPIWAGGQSLAAITQKATPSADVATVVVIKAFAVRTRARSRSAGPWP